MSTGVRSTNHARIVGGSFYPFHSNHARLVATALQDGHAPIAVATCFDSPNKQELRLRDSFEHRREMARLYLAAHGYQLVSKPLIPGVHITDLPYVESKELVLWVRDSLGYGWEDPIYWYKGPDVDPSKWDGFDANELRVEFITVDTGDDLRAAKIRAGFERPDASLVDYIQRHKLFEAFTSLP